MHCEISGELIPRRRDGAIAQCKVTALIDLISMENWDKYSRGYCTLMSEELQITGRPRKMIPGTRNEIYQEIYYRTLPSSVVLIWPSDIPNCELARGGAAPLARISTYDIRTYARTLARTLRTFCLQAFRC
jgi:hypothetical protein